MMLLNIVEIIWLVIYPSRIILQEELIGPRTCTLAKYVSYIKEIQKYFTKEKIQRVLYLENKI